MLTIRLNRVGKNKRASFRLAVQEHTVAPGGRHIELVGSYDPHTKKAVLKADRIKYWISNGAQVSDSAYNLLVREKAIEGAKRVKKIKKAVVPETKQEEAKADSTPSTSSEQASSPQTEGTNTPVGGEEVKAEEPDVEEAVEAKAEVPSEVAPEAPVAEEKKIEDVKAEEPKIEAVKAEEGPKA